MNRKTHILGVPFDVVTMDEAVARGRRTAQGKRAAFHLYP